MRDATGELSPPADVTCGIPQRSLLGPLLFTLYINDLPLVSNQTSWNLHADDAAIIYSSNDAQDMKMALNETLKVSEWFKYSRLSLNDSKTHLIGFGPNAGCKKMQNISINISGQAIQQCDKVKYLGLILDPQLTFNDHVNYIRSKNVGKIKLLSRISNVIKQGAALFLFKSFIRRIFDYCVMYLMACPRDCVIHCKNWKTSAYVISLE